MFLVFNTQVKSAQLFTAASSDIKSKEHLSFKSGFISIGELMVYKIVYKSIGKKSILNEPIIGYFIVGIQIALIDD